MRKLTILLIMCLLLVPGWVFSADFTVNYEFNPATTGEPASGYTIHWGESSNSWPNSHAVSGREGNFSAEFDYNKRYYFTVTARNVDGSSGYATQVSVMTPPEPSGGPPDPPSGLKINIVIK